MYACCCATASSTSLQAMDVLVKTSGDAFHSEGTKRAIQDLPQLYQSVYNKAHECCTKR
jgi:hypothetical protein